MPDQGYGPYWPQIALTIVSVTVSAVTSVHVLLNKRDTKATIGWIGLIWLSPFIGSVLYVLLGINRIRRKAQSLRRVRRRHHASSPKNHVCPPELLVDTLGSSGIQLLPLSRLVERVTDNPLLSGNHLVPLLNGDDTYPAMIRAIDGAQWSVSLSSYIFNNDRAGHPVAEALVRAKQRGVEVRVLIDSVGTRYGWPSIVQFLRHQGVQVRTFLPTFRPRWARYANLRNHRKIMVVDGAIGFTGGMNILEDYLHSVGPRRPKLDMHFEVHGPVVAAIQHVFVDDWAFATGETLQGKAWFPKLEPAGHTLARAVLDGPDETHNMLNEVLMGALSAARSRVQIITPYFLPDAALEAALMIAALRGVEVDILLPEKNNQILVQWASMPGLAPLLEQGVHIWKCPPPFDHSKLMIVDQSWIHLGSANWDPRSLELNFELTVECYDPEFAAMLEPIVQEKLKRAQRLSVEAINDRPLPVKIRDGMARLLSPYL
ncbi:cardiolipin synthase [soil metagenome]